MRTTGSGPVDGWIMTPVRLEHRGVVEVSGAEARAFLDRLVTCDGEPVARGRAAYGALLSPQGKILADFILFAAPQRDGFLLDAPAGAVGDLAKRLGLYRLRAKIAITDRSSDLAIVAGWGDTQPPAEAVATAPDPRLAALGWRAIVNHNAPYAEVLGAAEPRSTRDRGASFEAGLRPAPQDEDGGSFRPGSQGKELQSYHAHRIALGVPEGGLDFGFGEAFPHEALMDQLGGVDFDKGCYVGQEVVSRMQHRGTARTRIVPVRYSGEAPPAGTEVTAGDRSIGRTGTVAGQVGLATLRLDRVADAIGAGNRLDAGGVPLKVETRDWIGFAMPGRPAETAA